MRNRRLLNLFLVVLPSAAVAGGVFAANADSSGERHEAALAANVRVVKTEPAEAALSIGDVTAEARLLRQTAARLAAERHAAEALAAQQAAEAAALEEAQRQAALAKRTRALEIAQERAARRAALRAAAPKPAPVAAPAPAPQDDNDVWARLRHCEAGGNYQRNSGNGYYGAYQFSAGTWRSLGYAGLPHQAPPETQDEAAQRLQSRSGWGQWPACSRRIGAR